MSQQLLAAAREQAEHSEPAVRAAALLHIARVLARSDQPGAEKMLERALSLANALDTYPASLLLDNAVYLAAAVSPGIALQLYAERRKPDPFGGFVIGLVNAMAQHGHLEEAIDYFKHSLPGDRFPLSFVNNLDRECGHDATRLKLLRAAIQEWKRRTPGDPDSEEDFAESAFISFFGRCWSLLPPEEARPVLREVFDWSLASKNEPCAFPLTENPQDPVLPSERERLLFTLIPALQAHEPDRALTVLRDHPQLAAAVDRFPLGMESVREEQPRFNPATDDSMLLGHSKVIPMTEALATDFEAAFHEADKQYGRDSDPAYPNEAPKECWPSTWEFRNILFKAGQHLGLAAAKYLDRIPNADLRLFAQIELCAALEKLPQIAGSIAHHSSKSGSSQICSPAELEEIFEEAFGPAISGVRCPKCQWKPREKNLWSCMCGNNWNTFDTRGLCQQCGHQWEETECSQCREMSPHPHWYTG